MFERVDDIISPQNMILDGQKRVYRGRIPKLHIRGTFICALHTKRLVRRTDCKLNEAQFKLS